MNDECRYSKDSVFKCHISDISQDVFALIYSLSDYQYLNMELNVQFLQ